MSTNQITVNKGLIDELNSHLNEVCTAGDWMQQLDLPVQQFATRWRKKYDTKSVVELIEFIRDKRQHLIEWTEDVKQVFGNTNETYIEYFMSLFPRLLVITYVVMQKLKQEEMIISYYMYNLSSADFEL
jgi:serine/threonine-protein kinase/endoribonuclease IRE1